VSAEGGEKRFLGELVLVRSEYPRRSFSRAAAEEMARLIRLGVTRHTPLVVDRENHLLDGWRRFEAYKVVYPSDWPLIAVEVLVIDCPPEERLLRAALLNRVHGERLDDEDAARVAAKYALLAAPATPRDLRKRAAEYARMLAVETELVLEKLFPERKEKERPPLRVSPRPALLHDPEEFTVENVRLACEWLADALAVCGRDAAMEPDARSAMERAWAALDYALGERAGAAAEA